MLLQLHGISLTTRMASVSSLPDTMLAITARIVHRHPFCVAVHVPWPHHYTNQRLLRNADDYLVQLALC